jgi:glyoxylase-like metal-dependent hydrolase (beta-lactamase superfamily II)
MPVLLPEMKHSMQIKTFTFNPFQENTYLIIDPNKKCAIIDPGCYNRDEEKMLHQYIEKNKLEPVKLINTHAHIDHIFGNRFVADTYQLKLHLHAADEPILAAGERMAQMYDLHYNPSPEAEVKLNEDENVEIGETVWEVLHVPGHAPGHVVLVHHDSKQLIGGDVLFRESIGRTDLPGGNHQQLLNAIREKLWKLDDDYKVYPGHGIPTTIGHEKENNPFLN